MDAAPDTSLLALSVPPTSGGAAAGRLDHSVNSQIKQSFSDFFEGEILGVDAASEPDDSGSLLASTALRPDPLENADAAPQADFEASQLEPANGESGKTLPVDGTVLPLSSAGVEAGVLAAEKGGAAAVQGFKDSSSLEQGVALKNRSGPLGQISTAFNNSDEAKALASGFNPDKDRPKQSEAAMTALGSKAERTLPPGLNKPEENAWFFRQQEAGNPDPASKAKFTLDTKVDIDLRSPTDLPSARSPDQQAGIQSLLSISTNSAKTPPLHINTPMQADSAWANAFSEKISWLLGKGEQSATIQLAPEELGKLQLRITMNQGGTQIEVHARNQNTADLMESMLPKLQASLESQGIRMDEVKFSQVPLDTGSEFSKQLAQEGNPRSDGRQGSSEAETANSDSGEDLVALESSLLTPAGVDYYA